VGNSHSLNLFQLLAKIVLLIPQRAVVDKEITRLLLASVQLQLVRCPLLFNHDKEKRKKADSSGLFSLLLSLLDS